MGLRWVGLTILGCLTVAAVEGAPKRPATQQNQNSYQQNQYRSPLSGMMNRNGNNNRNNMAGYGNPANSFTDLTVTCDDTTAWRIAYAPTNATAAEKKALKGDDPKLPGYNGTNDDLKENLTIKVTRAKKRTPDPNKPDEVRYVALPDIIGTCKKIDGSAQFVVRYQAPGNSYGAVPNNNNNNNNRNRQQQQNIPKTQTQDGDTVVTIVYIYNKPTKSETTDSTASTKAATTKD